MAGSLQANVRFSAEYWMRLAVIAMFGWTTTAETLVAQTPPASDPAQQAPGAAAPAPTDQAADVYSMTDLEYLLGPIALYPDPLLALILPASTHPDEIIEAARWLENNPAAVARNDFTEVDAKPWDPSVQALTRFPDTVRMLADHPDWTESLGWAFSVQDADVAAVIQLLRARAESAGNLKSTPEQAVTTREEGGSRVIYIAPTNPERIYVPVYDSSVVFDTVVTGALVFGTAVLVGSTWNNRWGWNNRSWNQVWIRPPGPGWRPPVRPIRPPPGAWRPGGPGRPPGVRPDRPGIRPPGVRPDRPGTGVRPDRPGIRPDRPGDRPGLPGTGLPGSRPDRPGARPDRPGARPDRPAVRPDRPAARPERPATRPSRPETRPQRPAARPETRPQRPAARPQQRPASRPSSRPQARPSRPQQRPQVQRPANRPNVQRPQANRSRPQGARPQAQRPRPARRTQPAAIDGHTASARSFSRCAQMSQQETLSWRGLARPFSGTRADNRDFPPYTIAAWLL